MALLSRPNPEHARSKLLALYSLPYRTTLSCDREECERYVSSVWDWLEGLGTGVSRADPSTWAPPRWPPSYRGVINTLEVRHIVMHLCTVSVPTETRTTKHKKGGVWYLSALLESSRTLLKLSCPSPSSNKAVVTTSCMCVQVAHADFVWRVRKHPSIRRVRF